MYVYCALYGNNRIHCKSFSFANAGHTKTNQKRKFIIKCVILQMRRMSMWVFAKFKFTHSVINSFRSADDRIKITFSNNESKKECCLANTKALVYNHELEVVHCLVKVECRMSIEYTCVQQSITVKGRCLIADNIWYKKSTKNTFNISYPRTLHGVRFYFCRLTIIDTLKLVHWGLTGSIGINSDECMLCYVFHENRNESVNITQMRSNII